MTTQRRDDSLDLFSITNVAGAHLMALEFLYLLLGFRGLDGGLPHPWTPADR
ncbi:MAG: hypothetical protein HN891_02455 [Planctomycetes bacterium]|nr:hypothetical protein [Planctomycetota bacterium]MBT6453734.1 hypothetical protein [Planctomycetota bacterium]MBT6541878.1 hypothetical protein [Planctomycetota bacterium]MBT6784054.1 hypothetical protein [Planctomycetota bacterium]MBT7104052.1 hypothetical protein [Planctomycetota bacterium]